MSSVLKKTGVLIATLLLVSLLAFLAFQIIPADPVTMMLGTDYTPERAEALRHQLGLDRGVLVRYWDWLSGFVRGDMGVSYSYAVEVREVLRGKIAVTAALSLLSWVLVTAVSIPLGIALARYKGRKLEQITVSLNQILMSVPSFFLGILFTWLFGLVLRLFVPGRFVPFSESFWGCLGYLFFPALAISVPKTAKTAKLLRSAILGEMKQDYVLTAYSHGNSRWMVISRHVLRNALLPVVTYLAMSLADIVASSIIVEQVFVVPGLGRLLIASISNRDFPVALCIVVMIAFVVVVMNYLADLLTQAIDPRVRLS
ncbi:MAG: ABC transporter permease [Eubacteriales bacterium]|nr:ABC transporter permease [Eubacteriales bacterium]